MATKKRSTSKKSTAKEKTKVRVNMKGVEGRGSSRVKPDDYTAKIVKAVAGESSEKKTPQVTVTFQITSDGKAKSKKLMDNFYLTPNALWRFRNLLEACEIKVPNKAMDIDLKKLVGKEVGITVDDEEYENKIRSRVKDVFSADSLAEDEDDDLDEDDDDEDDDEEDDDEEEDEDDEDEDDEDDEDEDDDEDDEDEDDDDDLDDDVDLDDEDEDDE